MLQKMQVDEVFKRQALWKVFKGLVPEGKLHESVPLTTLSNKASHFLQEIAEYMNWTNSNQQAQWETLNKNILTFNDGTSCPQGVFVYLYNILITVPVNRKIAGSNEGILRSIAGYMIRPLLARS